MYERVGEGVLSLFRRCLLWTILLPLNDLFSFVTSYSALLATERTGEGKKEGMLVIL